LGGRSNDATVDGAFVPSNNEPVAGPPDRDVFAAVPVGEDRLDDRQQQVPFTWRLVTLQQGRRCR
jgi:hypothetical protein